MDRNDAKVLAATLRRAYGWATMHPDWTRKAIDEALSQLHSTGLIDDEQAKPEAYEMNDPWEAPAA